jgi:hypothetical protein
MRIGAVLALAALLWAAPGCKQKRSAAPSAQDAKRIPISVTMGDPRSAQQLVSGFYDIEGGAWRWTSKQFVVELGTPSGAAGRGAILELRFAVPPVVIEKNQSVTLTAAVDGNVLPPETYTKAGDYIYKQDVPQSLLGREAVKVSFEVDKALTPGGADERVLGVIATSASLIRK